MSGKERGEAPPIQPKQPEFTPEKVAEYHDGYFEKISQAMVDLGFQMRGSRVVDGNIVFVGNNRDAEIRVIIKPGGYVQEGYTVDLAKTV